MITAHQSGAEERIRRDRTACSAIKLTLRQTDDGDLTDERQEDISTLVRLQFS